MLHLDSQELRFPADSSKWEHWLRWSSARCKDAVSSGFSSKMRWKPIGFPFVFGNTFGTTDSGYIFVFGTSVSHQKLRNLDIGPMLSMATLGPKGRFEKGTHGSCYSILFMVNIPISWILHKCTLHCVYIYILYVFSMYIIQIMVKFVTWIFLDGPHPLQATRPTTSHPGSVLSLPTIRASGSHLWNPASHPGAKDCRSIRDPSWFDDHLQCIYVSQYIHCIYIYAYMYMCTCTLYMYIYIYTYMHRIVHVYIYMLE